MRRKPGETSVTALAAFLRRSRATTLALIAQAGIRLTPTELHHSDDRPRTRRNWRPLTPKEVELVLVFVRAKQGGGD